MRVGTGHYGARLALASSTASHKEFKIACLTVDDSSLGPGDEYFGLYTPKLLAVTEDDYESDPRMPGEDEFDHFYRVLAKKTDNLLSCYIPMPLALSEEEKAVQKEFKLIASGCIDLLVGAMRRTPAEKRRPLFLVFGELYPVFEFVRWTAEAGCAKWWMALQIIEKLEIVRKMVSSAFGGAPVDRSMVFARKVDLTGVDGEALAGHGLGSNLSVVIFVLMDSVFSNVKSDIDAMVSDPCRMADEDVQEFDHYYRHLAKRAAKLHAIYPPELPKPLSESEDEKAVQERFKEMANESIDLAAGAMRRIPAEKWRPLISVFAYVFLVFVRVRWYAERGCAKWWMAPQIIEGLQTVRRMVSSACGGTPLDIDKVFDRMVALSGVSVQAAPGGHGVVGSNDLSEVIFALIDNVFGNVKSDIYDMVSASTPC